MQQIKKIILKIWDQTPNSTIISCSLNNNTNNTNNKSSPHPLLENMKSEAMVTVGMNRPWWWWALKIKNYYHQEAPTTQTTYKLKTFTNSTITQGNSSTCHLNKRSQTTSRRSTRIVVIPSATLTISTPNFSINNRTNNLRVAVAKQAPDLVVHQPAQNDLNTNQSNSHNSNRLNHQTHNKRSPHSTISINNKT